MVELLGHIQAIVVAAWALFQSAAIYFLFGLVIAGLIHSCIRKESIGRHLGRSSLGAVIKAALLGVPLPLCSCGVLPAAVALRKEGASKGATISFLISTPESGVDSIAVTYALIDPIMAALRPIAAFITAFIAGIGEIFWGSSEGRPRLSGAGTTDAGRGEPTHARTHTRTSARITQGLHYAFTRLLEDIAPTFLLGMLLGGVISYLIPESFIAQYLGTEWQSMLVMLVVGIPIYICAAASTPIAAALILKGMSPGAALVFLLAGPATNITALPLLTKTLGVRSVCIYLGAIALCAMGLGIATNALYAALGIDIIAQVAHGHHPIAPWLQQGAAVLLLAAMVRAMVYSKMKVKMRSPACTLE
jgi:uncharacterized protein